MIAIFILFFFNPKSIDPPIQIVNVINSNIEFYANGEFVLGSVPSYFRKMKTDLSSKDVYKNDKLWIHYKFDDFGREVSYMVFNDSLVFSYWISEYDKYDNLIKQLTNYKEKVYEYDGDSTITIKHHPLSNSSNYITRERYQITDSVVTLIYETVDSKEPIYSLLYLNENGLTYKKESCLTSRDTLSLEKMTYDTNNRLIHVCREAKSPTKSGDLLSIMCHYDKEYLYTENGLISNLILKECCKFKPIEWEVSNWTFETKTALINGLYQCSLYYYKNDILTKTVEFKFNERYDLISEKTYYPTSQESKSFKYVLTYRH